MKLNTKYGILTFQWNNYKDVLYKNIWLNFQIFVFTSILFYGLIIQLCNANIVEAKTFNITMRLSLKTWFVYICEWGTPKAPGDDASASNRSEEVDRLEALAYNPATTLTFQHSFSLIHDKRGADPARAAQRILRTSLYGHNGTRRRDMLRDLFR